MRRGFGLLTFLVAATWGCGGEDGQQSLGRSGAIGSSATSTGAAAAAVPPSTQGAAVEAPCSVGAYIAAQPVKVDFGTVAVGQEATATLRLLAIGPAPAKAPIAWLADVAAQFARRPTPFKVASNDCNGGPGSLTDLAPGAACTIQLTYVPVSATESSASVLFGGVCSGGVSMIPLFGQGATP